MRRISLRDFFAFLDNNLDYARKRLVTQAKNK